MAVTASTKLADFNAGFLPPAQAGPIFELAARKSAIMSLAQQVPLGPNGVNVPVVSGRLAAGWVAEGAQKPASKAALTLKTMAPKKIAAIAVVSAEVVRANPGGYMDLLRPQIAEAFAIAFDYAATQNAGPDGTVSGGAFATYLAQGTKVVEVGTASQATGGIYKDFVNALALLVNNQNAIGRTYRMTGTALSPRAEPLLLSSVDTTGRPILLPAPYDGTVPQMNTGSLMGRPVFISDGVDYFSTLGWLGDWSQAAWGVVGGINYDVSTEASVTINGTLTSLFEYNLVAIRAEAEYGFLVNDVQAFVELTDVETS
jgi:HK97 family phage major capsid protein